MVEQWCYTVARNDYYFAGWLYGSVKVVTRTPFIRCALFLPFPARNDQREEQNHDYCCKQRE